MSSLPIVYSVFNRKHQLKQNLSLFKELGLTNIFFLIDTASYFQLHNIQCIKMVNDFCNNTGAKKIIKVNNYGYYCILTNFYKQIEPAWLSHYHVLIEDDFILTKEYFEFHNYIFKNYKNYCNYGLIVTFGFNVGLNKFKLFEINAKDIQGCLWGAGYNSENVKEFMVTEKYKTYNKNYLDFSYLRYLSEGNKKLLITSQNLITYKGFEDSRDKDRLITCTNYPELFNSYYNYEKLNFDIDNSYSEKYLKKHQFFVNDCKECS